MFRRFRSELESFSATVGIPFEDHSVSLCQLANHLLYFTFQSAFELLTTLVSSPSSGFMATTVWYLGSVRSPVTLMKPASRSAVWISNRYYWSFQGSVLVIRVNITGGNLLNTWGFELSDGGFPWGSGFPGSVWGGYKFGCGFKP